MYCLPSTPNTCITHKHKKTWGCTSQFRPPAACHIVYRALYRFLVYKPCIYMRGTGLSYGWRIGFLAFPRLILAYWAEAAQKMQCSRLGNQPYYTRSRGGGAGSWRRNRVRRSSRSLVYGGFRGAIARFSALPCLSLAQWAETAPKSRRSRLGTPLCDGRSRFCRSLLLAQEPCAEELTKPSVRRISRRDRSVFCAPLPLPGTLG